MPIAAAIPAIIGAAGSIGGALINKHSANQASNQAGSLIPAGLDQNALKDVITGQQDLAKYFQTAGKNTVEQGQQALSGPLKYLTGILGGDRNSIMEAIAPEVATINNQFNQPLREAQLTGANALLPDLNAQKQSAISNLMFQQRPQASDKLSSIGSALMGLGTQQSGLSGDLMGRAGGELLDYNSLIRGIQAQTRMDTPSLFGSLGQSLGPVLAGVLGGVFGKGGGGTNPMPPTAHPPIWNEVPPLPLPALGGGWH